MGLNETMVDNDVQAPTTGSIAARIPMIQDRPTYRRSKKLVDVTVASVGLVATSPLILALMALVKLDSDGPALYRPVRVGKQGKFFRQYKLRTMVENAPDLRNPDGSTLSSEKDPRVTRVGRVLRKTSMDELPQLVNVLRGQMSLVGPRPDPPAATLLYRPQDFQRLAVLPGLTGWAAVQGRNDLAWERRRDFDLDYVARRSGLLDLKVLILTVKIVLTGYGVHSQGSV